MATTDNLEHPEQIGPYRVVQVIGEGGMGVVYEAEQKEPVRRRVAVKMMKWGMDTKEIVGRFESERQALAVMDHPGIARVFDAGATDQGRPYFVMELVRGIRLDEYCDRQRLTTRDRVRLFIDVCEAVQHAHQKGVIHRDLKPGNILVSEEAGRPLPKVIDFGVAKATGQRLTERTVVTSYGHAVGTLAYMSPEQAEMSGLDVDTRADVYSLSVILYELLTGKLPLDPGTKGAPAFLGELLQRERTFPRLSEGLSTLDPARLALVAGVRSTDPAGLRKQLSGDLQWIVLKGMEKDRTRRYETANGLAMELRRYLRDEPVVARPPTARYRFGKFLRRNSAAAAAGGVAALALIAGLVAATAGMLRARAAEDVARREAETASQALGFLEDVFQVNDPSEARGNSITAREVLDAGAERIESELGDQPAVRARLLQTLGAVYGNLGLLERSEELTRASLEVQTAQEVGTDALRARTLLSLATLVNQQGDDEEADRLFAAGLGILEEAPAPTLQYAEALMNLGFHAAFTHGDFRTADSLMQRALSTAEDLLPPDDPRLAGYLNSLALLHDDDTEFAEPLLRRALEIYRSAYGWDHPETLSAGHNLYMVLLNRAEAASEAEAVMRQTLEGYESVYGAGHFQVARARTDFSLVLHQEGKDPEVVDLLRPALATLEQALGASAPETAWTRHHLARSLLATGRRDEGAAQLERAVQDLEAGFGGQHHYTAQARTTLAELRRSQGDPVEAERLLREALATLEGTFGPGHALLVDALVPLAEVLEDTGQLMAADSLYSRGVSLCRSQLGDRHPCAERAVAGHARVLRARGWPQRADSLLRSLPG